MRQLFRSVQVFSLLVLMLKAFTATSQIPLSNTNNHIYIKQELNTGVTLNLSAEREELRTDKSFFSLNQNLTSAKFTFESDNLLFLPSRHEQWGFSLQVGPFIGNGQIIDSTQVGSIDADFSPAGIRGDALLKYASRFYWDNNSYTLIDVSGWGRYDAYKNNGEGTLTDSNRVSIPYEDNSNSLKFRYGFRAKAGWGVGRLNIVNHYVTAERLLSKNFPGRIFSSDEMNTLAMEIGRIKHQREIRTGHSKEHEIKLLERFINEKMLLEVPVGLLNDWAVSEFRPRYNGSRIEGGPFFDYFNREPDFVYGGFLNYENHKYINPKMNRLIGVTITYNGYKRDDWVTLEVCNGWSIFPSSTSEITFGVRYLPGMVVKDLDSLQPIRHAVIPFVEYYTQLNASYRIESNFAYRFAKKDEFVMPGPEFTVSFYRSKY